MEFERAYFNPAAKKGGIEGESDRSVVFRGGRKPGDVYVVSRERHSRAERGACDEASVTDLGRAGVGEVDAGAECRVGYSAGATTST